MSVPVLSRNERIDVFYWMCLTRTFDEMMVAYWKQGRGLGGGAAPITERDTGKFEIIRAAGRDPGGEADDANPAADGDEDAAG